MFKKILVPIDVAEPQGSVYALKIAGGMAQAGGEVRLLSVLQDLPDTFLYYVPADYEVKQDGQATKIVSDMLVQTGLPEDRTSSLIRKGDVYSEILAEAESWNADIIVIGSHRPNMATYLLGSNATKVVRHAKCSVLVVRESETS